MAAKLLLIFFALFGFALSEVIPFIDRGNFPMDVCPCGVRPCYASENKQNYNECEINELRITPCKNQTHCTLKKGSTVNISFDYTPKFSSDAILTGLLWYNDSSEKSYSELPNADGCLYTSCPLEAGKKHTLNYNLQIAKKLPDDTYNLKWKIWTHSNKECYFMTTIELKR